MLLEDTHEMCLRVTAAPGQLAHGDGVGIVAVHVVNGRQQAVQFGVSAHHLIIKLVDGNQSDHTALVIMQGMLGGKRPFRRVVEVARRMHLVDQRLVPGEDLQVVLPVALGDDLGEDVEIAFSHDIEIPREMDGLSQRPTHVDVAGIQVLDHEHRARNALEHIEHLAGVGEFSKEVGLKTRHGHGGGILPLFGGFALEGFGRSGVGILPCLKPPAPGHALAAICW